MAAQRLFIATLAGKSADVAADLFAAWRKNTSAVDAAVVDRFCASVRENSTALQVIYFSEWMDRWLMGDRVPGPGAVDGRRYQATSFARDEAMAWANRCGNQYQEQDWLAARLKEAASAWSGLTDQVVVVVVREVFDVSTGDDEIQKAFGVVPTWLSGG